MKNLIFLLLINIYFVGSAQLPVFQLRDSIPDDLVLQESLIDNEICLIFQNTHGWSSFDTNHYYFIKNDGKVKYYKEEVPKSYLGNKKELKRRIEEISVDENLNSKIISLINSKELKGFMKYSQEDFKINQGKEIFSSCSIYDAEGYGIKIIQKSKQNSYHYYAPKFFYEKCADEAINKSVLKKYIELIDWFES